MIYVTGDTHGQFDGFMERFCGYRLNADDTVIICGDFGFIFSYLQKNDFEKLEKVPFTILFVDGNHENFPEIYKYTIEEWHGGKIHRIAPNIIHLMRGQLYEIEGKSFFTMGGAYSADRGWRVQNESWWEQELPNSEEYRTAIETLEMCGYKTNYILTHDAPNTVLLRMGIKPNPRGAELTGFLERVLQEAEFDKWFFGHYHSNTSFDEKLFCLYDKVESLE